MSYPEVLWPQTVAEAVDLLIAALSPEAKRQIAGQIDEFSLIGLCHHGIGTFIRNQFGLWKGNAALLQSCGAEWISPDRASTVILRALWKRLRNESHLSEG